MGEDHDDDGRDQRLMGWWSSPGLSVLLGAVTDGVALLTADTRLLAANDRAATLFGLDPTMLVNQPMVDPSWAVLDVDGQPLSVEDRPVVRCLRTGQPQRVPRLGLQIGDRLLWVRMCVDPVRLDGTALDGLLLTFGPVAADAVPDHGDGRGEESSPSSSLDAPLHGARVHVRLSAQGQVLDASGPVDAVLGHPIDVLRGRPFGDLLHPLDAERISEDPRTLQRQAAVYRVRTSDGGLRWLQTSADLVNDDRGAIQHLDLTVTDVTDRHIVQQSLQQAEERFRLAFDMAPIGTAIVLPDGRFMRVNETLATMLGVASAELLGRRWPEVVLDQDVLVLERFLSHVLSGGPGTQVCDIRMLDLRGRRLQCAVTASSILDQQGSAAYVIAHIEDVTARRLTQSALSHQASHDALTTLPNRTLLLDRLGHAIVDGAADPSRPAVAALFCDLDRFKRINDSLGHDVGDLVLVEVARRLRGAIGRDDTAGRLGGDEFLVVAARPSRDGLLTLAQQLRAITDDPITIAHHHLQLSLSVGVAIASRGERPAELLRRADTAMYEAKERGRNRVEIYDQGLRLRARHRLQTETDLKAALTGAELRLFLQPIVSLADSVTVGREALMRWAHPRRGLLEPADFLPIAEESTLILELGAWAMEEATRQAVSLVGGGDSAHISVNVSARQVALGDLRSRVETALTRSGLPGDRLVLELTESVLLDASQRTVAELESLTQHGVRLAVDDFGTGYSSLTYLQKLPVSMVKIDRSFVTELTQDRSRRAIVQAVIDLGAALELEVVAEGIEREDQAMLLVDLGCRFGQGYLYGRPAQLVDPVAP